MCNITDKTKGNWFFAMRNLFNITIPVKVRKVLDCLHREGYEAFAVGGCVRDMILGCAPDDWDITTSAKPEEIKRIFPATIDTGIEHGTVTVRMDGESFEVTTYRLDGNYEDHRHPDRVEFTSSLREDLRRRDFTINAMAYNEEEGLVDLFDGLGDLKRKLVRCVGEPRERFTEDALRIFRAVRFCAKLGFELDPGTRRAAEELAPSLKLVSAERIQTELVKLLVSPHPEMISLAWECGITAQVLPEFDLIMEAPQNNPHHIFSVGEHTIRTLMAIRADRILRLTMLFHDMGKPSVQTVDENGIYHHRGHAAPGAEIAGRIMRRLKFDRASERSVVQLVRCHSLYPDLTLEGVRRAVVRIGEDLFPLFLEVKCADIRGQNPEVQKEKLAYMDRVKELYEEILADGDCLSLKQLAVSGDDLLADGMKKGPELGSVLQALLDEVLEDPARNRKEYLLERSRSLRA